MDVRLRQLKVMACQARLLCAVPHVLGAKDPAAQPV